MANWISGAIKEPGALHQDLGVRQGQKIPPYLLKKKSHGNSKVAQRARLALTLSRMNRKGA